MILWQSGDCLNIKMLSYQYKNSHYKDKDRLIFLMEISIHVKVLILRQGPGHNNGS